MHFHTAALATASLDFIGGPINFTFGTAVAAAGGINHNFHDKSAAWLGSTNLGNKSERSFLNKCTGKIIDRRTASEEKWYLENAGRR